MKILLIEDNAADVRLFSEKLKKGKKDYEVINVARLSDGLAVLAENDIDIVVLDLMLPDSRSINTFDRVYERAGYVPIVIISGMKDEAVAIEAVRRGAQDYLIKRNIDTELLVRTITYSIERKHLLELVKQSERKFSGICNAAMDAIIMMDEQGSISYWNKAAENIFGYTYGEVEGRDLHSLLAPPRYEGLFREGFKRFLETGKGKVRRRTPVKVIGETLTLVASRKDGSEFPAEISVSTFLSNNKLHAIGIVRDISERKQAEALIIHSEKMAAIGQIAAGVAHEINSPINSIINCAEMIILNKGEKKKTDTLASFIKDEGTRISGIINSLLSFARTEGMEKKALSIKKMIDEIIILSQSPLKQSGIKLQATSCWSFPEILGDANRLKQVFLNIINNAIDALNNKYPLVHEDKSIDITCEKVQVDKTTHVRIIFYDKGEGIPPEDIDKVWAPFFTTKPSGKGTGLGLSSCYNIINDHKGKIFIESQHGEFTKVIIELPMFAKE